MASVDELVAIDDAGGKEIDEHLYPQGLVFELHVAHSSIHQVHTHIGPHAEGAGEYS